MKKTSLFVCICLICSLLFCSCSSFYYDYIDPILFPEEQYYKGANWNCELDEFETIYLEIYTQKIEELKEKYSLSFSTKLDIENSTDSDHIKITFLLYCEEYTIRLNLSSSTSIGYLYTYLYYYADNNDYHDYSKLQYLLGFINDFTNYVGYDTKTDKNYFDALYFDALDNEENFATYYYHYDSTIGNVGYIADLNSEAGYYYMGACELTSDKPCSKFLFEGLLKPLL